MPTIKGNSKSLFRHPYTMRGRAHGLMIKKGGGATRLGSSRLHSISSYSYLFVKWQCVTIIL